MIPTAYITQWRQVAPWPDDMQVEQDLILFFYFSSWYYKACDSTTILSRNDVFDSAHCSYIPYIDIFVTDRGNAHAAKIAIKNFNRINQNRIQTQIFSKCEDLLNSMGL